MIKSIRLPSKPEAAQEDLNKLRYILRHDNGEKELRRRIDTKIASYLSQDKRRRPRLPAVTIPRGELVRKLLDSGMKCFYCSCNLAYGGDTKHDRAQWSLDRIDNSKNHHLSNCLVSCLDCNLRRRRRPVGVHSKWRDVRVVKKQT